MKDVEGWWEVPSICYYCSLLGNAFGLPDFTIERLEEALSTEEDDILLSEMFTSLTQAILPDAIDKSWREKVAVILSERNKTNPLDKTDIEKKLTSWEKLDLLYNLCEMRMECADVNGIIKTIEKWQLKTLPIGEDSSEMLYWYFCGTRIYKQDLNVEHLERKSARRSVKRQKSTSPVMMSGMKKYAYETLLKLQDTPRSNLIKEDEGHHHWSITTISLHESQLFTARFETSTEPEEETLYRNLVKVVLPKIDLVVAEQERKELMAGERKGLTRSGRKVVARYKNGFVVSTDPELSDNKSDTSRKEDTDPSKRQSKRRRTQPPQATATPVRRSSRHNSGALSPAKMERSPAVRTTSRTTRRSSKLEEFTEPPSTDTDDEVDENEEEDNEEEEEEEEEQQIEKKTPSKERQKPGRKPPVTPAKRRGPGRPSPGNPTIREQIAAAVSLRDKERKGKAKHIPTGDGDPDLVERMSDVMATLTRHPEAWQFNEPVNDDFAPYYYTLIENPKDFNTVERAVINQHYRTVTDFVGDINLVFTNCYDYNGPINEYTRAARILEKYFRRLMRELCREDYTFDGHSVIYPGKRLFVNRHKRIKALKLAGINVTPQRNKPLADESSRDSSTSNLRSPGGNNVDENSNDGSETSTAKQTTKRRPSSRRKKTTDPEQGTVSFTALLSEGGGGPGPHGYHHPGYPPYYYGYYDPYRAGYYHPPVENTAPTYIELSPRPSVARKRMPCKNDEEPLLFPHLHKPSLPKPTLSANKIPEDLMLRDLAANQPSQINRIDSTTTPPEKKKEATPNSTSPAEKSGTRKVAAPDSTIQPKEHKKNGEFHVNGGVGSKDVHLNNEAVPKDTSEASPKKVVAKEALKPAAAPAPPPAPPPAPHQPYQHQQVYSNGYYGQHYNSGYYPQHPGNYPQHPGNYPQHPGNYPQHPGNYSQYQDPYQGGGGYHHHGYQSPYHHHYHQQQQQQQQVHHHAMVVHHHTPTQYPPSPLLGEQALYVSSRTKQITTSGRSRGSRSRGRSSTPTGRSSTPTGRSSTPTGRSGTPSKSRPAPPSPITLEHTKDITNGASGKEDTGDKILPPTPPKETKKQKKIFDIRIPPKKRVRS